MVKMTFDELFEQACEDLEFHIRSVNSSMSEESINDDVINGISYAIECLVDNHDQHLTEEEEQRLRDVLEETYHWYHILRNVFDFEIDVERVSTHCAGCDNIYNKCDCYCKECGVNTSNCDC